MSRTVVPDELCEWIDAVLHSTKTKAHEKKRDLISWVNLNIPEEDRATYYDFCGNKLVEAVDERTKR